MLKKSKKGELTTKQIVSLIILITSFAIILVFIFFLDLGETTDKEICHNSVVMRSNSILPTESIPLDCKTSYICISEDGSCEKMTNPEIKKVKTDDDVYEVLAEQMVDCWWMFGEGKVDYVGKDFWSSDLYCSICSQIAFDDSVGSIFSSGKIEERELYNYLNKNEIKERGMTYYEYMYDVKELEKLENAIAEGGGTFGEINLDSYHYVVMGIYSDISNVGYIAVGAVAVGAAAYFLSNPVGWTSATILFVAVGTGTGAYSGDYIGTIVNGESGNDFLRPEIIEANSNKFEVLKCGSIKTLA